VRALVEKHLPAEYRAKFTWRQLAGLLRRAAEGQQDVAEVSYRAPDRAAARRGHQVPMTVSVSPFFGFVLALVIPGTLVILLVALLWTRR
jgi:predicted secreted protein